MWHESNGAPGTTAPERGRAPRVGQQFELAWLAVVAGNSRARGFYEGSGWLDKGLATASPPVAAFRPTDTPSASPAVPTAT